MYLSSQNKSGNITGFMQDSKIYAANPSVKSTSNTIIALIKNAICETSMHLNMVYAIIKCHPLQPPLLSFYSC